MNYKEECNLFPQVVHTTGSTYAQDYYSVLAKTENKILALITNVSGPCACLFDLVVPFLRSSLFISTPMAACVFLCDSTVPCRVIRFTLLLFLM